MNALSNFGDFALTRAEMKKIMGGSCFVRGAGAGGKNLEVSGANAAQVAQLMAKQEKTNWCCDNCGSASWCQNGQC